jgi:anthranilate synthase/indole-3-glycerol phosphate synthase/phosphoribosylanthranilate isomerase
MEIALDCGAKVIGVNNRNLHTFKLDLDTTAKVTSVAKSRGYTWVPSKQGDGSYKAGDITIAALSGITSSEDVQKFRDIGVGCVLVGETLMKSNDPAQTIADLLSEDTSKMSTKLVKVCGVTSGADASVALQAGANLIGIIFAPKSPRCASLTAASEVVDTVRKYGERSDRLHFDSDLNPLVTRDNAGAVKLQVTPQEWFSTAAQAMNRMTLRRPLTVGVFQVR